ncbi:hypothetical protein Hanom_Chr09g00837211 [Helianthus anomalus]
MKEKSAADELTKLADFKATRNEWFTKEEKKKRSRKTTPKVQAEEGSSSQLKKKHDDETEVDVERDQERLSFETEQLLKTLNENLEAEKVAGEESDDKEKSSSDSEVDETDHWKKVISDKEKQKKRKRSGDDDDEAYIPSLEHVLNVQKPPSEGRKKSSARKRVVSSVDIPLEDIGDFNFVTDDVVKRLQKKVEEVIVENKKFDGRVKTVEAENSSLSKKIEADQAEIDILKVGIAELEEEKARRDEQNEYFKLKNKELEAINAKKENEMYMMNKVLENLIGKSVEQKFEEIDLEEVRARRKAEMEAEMKNKGKGVQVKGVYEVTERAIVPSIVPESPIQNPCPISAVSGVFDEDVEVDDVVNDDEEDDDEEDEEEVKKDDADDVFSANSDHDDDDNDDDDHHGSTDIKVTDAFTEENVDDYLHDDANEEPENAEGEGEHDDSKNVDDSEKLILCLEPDIKEGEIRHTYTLDEIIKMTHVEDIDFKFDFEEELNQFDINQQPDYQYKIF